MMLVEIVRRAAHDWILYRTSTRLCQKQIAEEAYDWLFKEEPGTPMWVERKDSRKELTSLVGICCVLSLDVEEIRSYVRRLTVKDILSTGRPPTYRKQKERRPQVSVRPLLLPKQEPKAVLYALKSWYKQPSPLLHSVVSKVLGNKHRLARLLQEL